MEKRPLGDNTQEGMIFLGLQVLIDPPRPEAAEAIARAKGAGIRVIMITGDNALTARGGPFSRSSLSTDRTGG
jgi:magnesium-transporting ATPase (P-type)